MLGIALHLAIERIRRRHGVLRHRLTGQPVAIDGAGREKDAAADAGTFCRLEQPHRAIQVEPAKARGIVAFAAAIFTGHMSESRMDEEIDVVEGVDLVFGRIETQRNKGDRL